ncbi:uncharacterized protein PHACADRAFT_259970 [Phanerochaete carnosa HHB-10118-sp]|uniref:Uncharacterized protein n=1 Tax=Phanerochaete carnosa (strain HHB-10118-sp) TaxID=650164 RepID=K5W329_PHACS|nr:uncharacterized protein PHACADRAFT_259970 [Phanerochaete carnosa HHB-10118-sp]EKM53545.1 hypothetical protein PHACADRAFT_259970 [Phanerochaete carnosa HHB-10118-sp]
MHSAPTSAYATSSISPCTCTSLPAQLAHTPVLYCTKIIVSSGGSGQLVDTLDCGSAYCRSSAQYAAAQSWMGGLDQ